MARIKLSHTRLKRIGEAPAALLGNWREGVSLAGDSGLTIDALKLGVAAARWKLAAEYRRDAKKLLRLRPPPFRSVISRFYYAMYHSMRAACYVYHDGDDHESHSNLPLHIPGDFPNAATCKNTLKSARLARNAADYDPYPKSGKTWQRQAEAIRKDAEALLVETRNYLRSKGCTGL
jgi:uncharacterized protein (UPF0332 family)